MNHVQLEVLLSNCLALAKSVEGKNSNHASAIVAPLVEAALKGIPPAKLRKAIESFSERKY